MTTYTKTFALCDNVDVRVHCRLVTRVCGLEMDDDELYDSVELVIGDQVVKLEGELEDNIRDAICTHACDMDYPDGVEYDDEEEADFILGVAEE